MTPTEVAKKLELAGVQDHDHGVITDLSVFRSAIGLAKLKNNPYVEVNEEIFNYLANGTETPYIQYEGIRVYKENTRAECERNEKMPMDEAAKIRAAKWRADNPDKCY